MSINGDFVDAMALTNRSRRVASRITIETFMREVIISLTMPKASSSSDVSSSNLVDLRYRLISAVHHSGRLNSTTRNLGDEVDEILKRMHKIDIASHYLSLGLSEDSLFGVNVCLSGRAPERTE